MSTLLMYVCTFGMVVAITIVLSLPLEEIKNGYIRGTTLVCIFLFLSYQGYGLIQEDRKAQQVLLTCVNDGKVVLSVAGEKHGSQRIKTKDGKTIDYEQLTCYTTTQ